MEEDIKRFLAFWEKYGSREDVRMYMSGDLLCADRCSEPGCCSDRVDLGELAGALRELVGPR